jgi:prepilin-type processing-associated H-X9-DG protein
MKMRSDESNKVACLTIERRVGTALLLYAQDHDGNLPVPEYTKSDGSQRTWVNLLQSYLAQDEKLSCPLLDMSNVKDRSGKYSVASSLTLNERFFGKFSSGAFPLDNLEIPGQTAMVVEGGPYTLSPSGNKSGEITYSDLFTHRSWYNAPHTGKINVAAADGHLVTLTPPKSIVGHDAMYGRLAGTIYNWNGGHPNGDTAGYPRD